MANPSDFMYLKGKFGGYDPVYLDPLVCDVGIRKSPAAAALSALPTTVGTRSLPSWSAFWRLPSEMRLARFLRRLVRALDVESDAAAGASFLLGDGAGVRFNNDRMLQRAVRDAVNDSWTDLCSRHYDDVGTFLGPRTGPTPIADQPDARSVVAVDGMLANLSSIPQDIQWSYREPLRQSTSSVRTVHSVLSDIPGPLLSLADPAIGLMCDEHTFYTGTETFQRVLSTGWYPYARVIGLYATSPGGRPFINVLMILLAELPPMDALLVPDANGAARSSLPMLLEDIRLNALQPEIARPKHRQPPGSQPVGLSTPYQRDEEFLAPLHFTAMCCKLNRVKMQGLKMHAPEAWREVAHYLQRLGVLGEQLQALDVPSRIPAGEAAATAWLQELMKPTAA